MNGETAKDPLGPLHKPETELANFLLRNLPRILVWPVVAALLMWLWWSLTLARLADERESVRQHAFSEASSLAGAYAEQLRFSLEQLDYLTLSLKYSREDPGIALDLEEQRAKGLYPDDAHVHANIIDRNGDIVTTTLATETRPNLADMEFFQVHKNGRPDGLLIGKPGIGRRTGRVIIRFSRRVDDAGGSFGGVVSVGVEPAYFGSFHNVGVLGDTDFISVRFADGPLLVTNTRKGLVSAFYRSDPVYPTPSGVRMEPIGKFADGQQRIVAWKKLDNYPLVAMAALSVERVFAPYEALARDYRRIAMAGTAMLTLFALFGMYFSARLAWRKKQEEEATQTYRLATDAANEGFYMIRPLSAPDGSIRDFLFEDCNDRGAAMVAGLPRERVVGRRVSEVLPEKDMSDAFAAIRRAMATGFYEDERSVTQPGNPEPAWVYRRLVRSGSALAVTLRDISKEKAHQQELCALASTDALTKLPNRYWLSNKLPEVLAHAKTHSAHVAILFIDLDNFKNINDTLGHATGDMVLNAAAMRLKATVRASDHVVRLGGDEFMVILEQAGTIEDVRHVANLVLKSTSEPFDIAGAYHLHASIGISIFPKDGEDSETLIKHADIAMYAAKAAGKGRYHFYQPYLSDRLLQKLNKEIALRKAIKRDEFVLHYQPRVDTQTGQLSSMEALVRWNHPERGLVMPAEFIDIAEDTGLILGIGEIVIEKACAQIAAWQRQNLALVPVSVNVSGLQIKERRVSAQLARCIEEYGFDPALIEVELTESTMIGSEQAVLDELRAIRALGVKLLIDDFGTGYSSLAQLQSLDVDVVKVDRAFTRSLDRGTEGEAFFRAIVSMADALGMAVVAEGVETTEQLQILQSLSCNEIQGHLISRAISAGEMTSLMDNRFFFPPSALPGNALIA